MREEQAAVASPCTNVCTIDPASGLCAGCLRTLDEIARWGVMDEDEKRTVIAGLPARRIRTGGESRDLPPVPNAKGC